MGVMIGGSDSEGTVKVGEGSLIYDKEKMRAILGEELAKKMLEDAKNQEILAELERDEAMILSRLTEPFRQSYIQAKLLGLNTQAEIALVEGLTGTTFMNLDEQICILYRNADLRLGYAIGSQNFLGCSGKRGCSAKDYPHKLDSYPLRRIAELQDFFREIRIVYIAYSAHDAVMYGVHKNDSHFLIAMSDAGGWK